MTHFQEAPTSSLSKAIKTRPMLFHFVCCGTFGRRKEASWWNHRSIRALRLATHLTRMWDNVIDSQAFKTQEEIEFEWLAYKLKHPCACTQQELGERVFDGKFSKRKIRFHNTPLLDYDSWVAFRRIPLEQHRCRSCFESEFKLKPTRNFWKP